MDSLWLNLRSGQLMPARTTLRGFLRARSGLVA